MDRIITTKIEKLMFSLPDVHIHLNRLAILDIVS